MTNITREQAAILAEKKLKGTITPEEDRLLAIWAAQEPGERMFWEEGVGEDELRVRLLQNIKATAQIGKRKTPVILSNWLRYAAAVIIIAGIGTLLWNTLSVNKDKQLVQSTPEIPDVTPGKNKAVLTLSDGRTIILDSAVNGQLATQQNARILKKDGHIIYDAVASAGKEEVIYNTMSTPRGGQYQLTLPDGSKAWLNSTSEITYPVVFEENQRTVTVTGEVYFEVAKDKQRPFIVKTGGNYSIEVLGTHFNVNAYSNEDNIRTTLLEGSVRINTNENKATLKAGQQAVMRRSNENKITVSNDVDIDEIMSWQKGIFMFDNSDLPAIARQLSRWYNVDVVTEGNPGKLKLGGGISKNLLLTEVLELLKANKVNYRWENNKVIITSS